MEKPKSEIVHDYIEEKIMSGEYAPGERIPSEAYLCKELGVSRVSVRSGVEKLIAIGLLSKKKNGSTFVNEKNSTNYLSVLTPTLIHNIDYLEMLELRQALDALSTSLCIRNIDDAGLTGLKELLIEMEQFEGDSGFFELDKKFHLIISTYSHNVLLHNFNEIMWDVLEKNGRSSYHKLGNQARIVEHRRILDAIINKDDELAKIYSIRHLERTIKDLHKKS